MRFEILQTGNFKKFGGEYLMIVLSILTALALEDFAQDMNHRSLAKQASIKIDAEIQANIVEVEKILAHNEGQVQKLEQVRKLMLKDIKSGLSDAELAKRVLTDYQGAFDLSIQSPSLRREAWEVAVANQSVSWMPNAELNRYSVAYANMRDMQSANSGMNNYFLDGPRMLDIASDAQMGAAAARDVYRMVNQIITSHHSINGNLRGLRNELKASAAAAPKQG